MFIPNSRFTPAPFPFGNHKFENLFLKWDLRLEICLVLAMSCSAQYQLLVLFLPCGVEGVKPLFSLAVATFSLPAQEGPVKEIGLASRKGEMLPKITESRHTKRLRPGELTCSVLIVSSVLFCNVRAFADSVDLSALNPPTHT